MRKCKVISALLLCVCVVFCLTVPGSAYRFISYSFSPDASTVFCDHYGVYIASSDSNRLLIEKVVPDSFSRTLTLPYRISDYRISANQATALCVDELNRQTVIFFYDIDADYLDSFSVAGYTDRTDMGFAADNNGVYLCDKDNPNIINRYAYNGKREYFYEFETSVTCITQDYSGNVYAVSDNCLYRLEPASLILLSGDEVYRFVRFIGDDILVDLSGWVVSVSSGTSSGLFRGQDADGLGAVYNGSIYLASGNTVYRYNTAGKATGYHSFDYPVVSLCSDQNSLLAITSENGLKCSFLTESDMTDIQNDNDNSALNNRESITASGGIFSDVYRIDYQNGMIYDIPPKTSLSVFKDNIRCDGYTLSIYRENSLRKNGYAATAMTAYFSSNDSRLFELCVNGDVTGDGKVDSKDKTALMDYLLGSWDFSGAYLYSADLNFDDRIDLLDVVRICRLSDN